MINPRIDCSQSPLAVRLSPEEVVDLDLQDPKRLAEWRRFAAQFNGPVHAAGDRDAVYHCGGGINSFAIDPQGKMSICVLSHKETYDLRLGNFRNAWHNFLLKVRQKQITRLTKCTDCELKAMCGMCPANGELEHEDPESPVDFLCQVAHLRALALDLSITPHGECEYCAGGSGYEDLRRSLASLRDHRASARFASETGMTMLPMLSEVKMEAGPGRCHGGCADCQVLASHGR
jgi:radical SAM protein with 4Fe4S-binding SPASM domain